MLFFSVADSSFYNFGVWWVQESVQNASGVVFSQSSFNCWCDRFFLSQGWLNSASAVEPIPQ